AHRADEPLRNREAESASLVAVALGVPELEELVEHPIELVGGNAGPGVAHRDLDPAVRAAVARGVYGSPRAELDGVVDQVGDDALELHTVRPDPDRRVDDVAREADTPALRDRS